MHSIPLRSRRRALAPILLACLLLAGMAGPTLATDPTPAPDASEPTDAELQPGVHAEMLAEHEDDPISFTPGEAPSVALATPEGGGRMQTNDDAGGSVTRLANGLRREVLGYLPHWSLSDAGALNYEVLSTIAYFGVGARSDGTLATDTAGWFGWTSSTMTNVTNQAHARGVKVVLTVTMMSWNGNYTEMTAFLNSGTARSRLIGQIVATVRDRRADGVNLDWEPVPGSLRNQYTSFVREVKQALVSAGVGSYVTVATMAGAARSSTSGYDVAGLVASGGADALMVMGYDFSWSGSARAGGVAPIDNPYILDVREAMRDHVARVPASRIIWGVPYYGRGWTTQDATLNAYTCKTGDLCPQANASAIGRTFAPTYNGALNGATQHGRLWDGPGQVPYYRYFDNAHRAWTQVYYDDAQSLAAKYTLVEANGLGGIGIWTLLMDAGRPELSAQIDTFFRGIWFNDILFNPFRDDILWVADAGIAAGCGNDLYCPTGTVTRGQMAAFLGRALGLPATSQDPFWDDESSQFEADINRLAAAGIASGCGGGRFCPDGTVTRGQMAAFLVRALRLPPAAGDYFSDDETNQFEADINALAASGVTGGCGGGRFCPDIGVSRGEMAAFLRRAFAR